MVDYVNYEGARQAGHDPGHAGGRTRRLPRPNRPVTAIVSIARWNKPGGMFYLHARSGNRLDCRLEQAGRHVLPARSQQQSSRLPAGTSREACSTCTLAAAIVSIAGWNKPSRSGNRPDFPLEQAGAGDS
jgi:hypothetical protein